MVPEFEEKIRHVLKKEANIVIAYLFGSAARDEMTSLSDIDIGILFNSRINAMRRYDVKLELMGEISSASGLNRVDIVDMEKGSVLLNYNIIKNGKILKSNDENLRVRFETSILSRYLDEKYYLQRHTDQLLKRIASRGLA
jgi:predicted nucleotidyltransferase